jgi:hypothetical protein
LLIQAAPPRKILAGKEIVAKHKNARRTRTKARSDGPERTTATTLTADQLHLRRQRWRALKQQFDDVHHAGMLSLKQRDYESLHAAILHERRIIDELQALIQEVRTRALELAKSRQPSRR